MSAFRGPPPARYSPRHGYAAAAPPLGAQGGRPLPRVAAAGPPGAPNYWRPQHAGYPVLPQDYAFDIQAYPPPPRGPGDELFLPLRVLVRSLETLGGAVLQGTGAACSALNCGDTAASLWLGPGEEGQAWGHTGSPYGQQPYPPSPMRYAAYPPSPMPDYAARPRSPVPGRAAYQAWPPSSPGGYYPPRDGGRPRRADASGVGCCGGLLEWPASPWEDWNPDLRVPQHAPPLFEFSCAKVVSSTEGDEWNGRWHLTKEERLTLLNTIDRGGKDGELSLTELKGMRGNRGLHAAMEYMPGSAKGLLNPDYVVEVFARFDADRSGAIDASEWSAFLDALAEMHQEYLQKKAHVAFRAFWGRSAVWNIRPEREHLVLPWEALLCASLDCAPGEQQQHRRPPPPRCFQVGRDPDGRGNVFPPGWWADLYYYSANNHPLHGIFAADPAHPLSRMERFMLEASGFGFLLYVLHADFGMEENDVMVSSGKLTILGSGLLASASHSSLVKVTLPSMAIWWILFLLFTCPCAIVDESRTTRTCCSRLTHGFGALVGYVLVAAGLVYLLDSFLTGHIEIDDVLTIARGRLRGYLFSWALEVCVYFNLFLAWGQTDPSKSGSCCSRLCCWIGDNVGLGQWRIEKQLFQARCAANVGVWRERHEELTARAARQATPPRHRAESTGHSTHSSEALQTRLSAVAAARRAPAATPPSSQGSFR